MRRSRPVKLASPLEKLAGATDLIIFLKALPEWPERRGFLYSH